MRKLIAILSIATFAMVACNKKNNTSGDSFNYTGKSNYRTMSSTFTDGQLHNMAVTAYAEKYGFDDCPETVSDVKVRMERVADILDSITGSSDFSAIKDTAYYYYVSVGMANPDGSLKSSSAQLSIAIALEPDADLREAMENIHSNTTDTGAYFASYVHGQMSFYAIGDVLLRRNGFLEIFDSSANMNNTVYAAKGDNTKHAQAVKEINKADAAGYLMGFWVGTFVAGGGSNAHSLGTQFAVEMSIGEMERQKKLGNL